MARACSQLVDSASKGLAQCVLLHVGRLQTSAFTNTSELHPMLRQLRKDLINKPYTAWDTWLVWQALGTRSDGEARA